MHCMTWVCEGAQVHGSAGLRARVGWGGLTEAGWADVWDSVQIMACLEARQYVTSVAMPQAYSLLTFV